MILGVIEIKKIISFTRSEARPLWPIDVFDIIHYNASENNRGSTLAIWNIEDFDLKTHS